MNKRMLARNRIRVLTPDEYADQEEEEQWVYEVWYLLCRHMASCVVTYHQEEDQWADEVPGGSLRRCEEGKREEAARAARRRRMLSVPAPRRREGERASHHPCACVRVCVRFLDPWPVSSWREHA